MQHYPGPPVLANVHSLMSPNGTLLAYSKPVDIKELRDQAALISIVWKDNCASREKAPQSAHAANESPLKPALKTLTVETEDCNIIVRLLQSELLLVLVGRIPPKKQQPFRITPEAHNSPRYPDIAVTLSRPSSATKLLQGDTTIDRTILSTDGELSAKNKAPSLRSSMSQREKDIRVGALHIQRKKIDALAKYILKDFEDTGFVMPADSDLQ